MVAMDVSFMKCDLPGHTRVNIRIICGMQKQATADYARTCSKKADSQKY
jgi:hypothetical protein